MSKTITITSTAYAVNQEHHYDENIKYEEKEFKATIEVTLYNIGYNTKMEAAFTEYNFDDDTTHLEELDMYAGDLIDMHVMYMARAIDYYIDHKLDSLPAFIKDIEENTDKWDKIFFSYDSSISGYFRDNLDLATKMLMARLSVK